MSEDPKDVIPAAAPAPDSSTETKAPEKETENDMIPRTRLNEESEKRRKAEERLTQIERENSELKQRTEEIARAISGGKMNAAQSDDEIASLAKDFQIPEEFVSRLLSTAEKRLKKQDPATLQAQQEVLYTRDFEKLLEEAPEADNLSREERAELKKLAFSKEYLHTPLPVLYRSFTYDKRPTGKEKTFEDTRPGGREKEVEEKDISKMSDAEFRAFLAKNTKSKRR